MASNYAYHLTTKAQSDLRDIVRYIAVDLANPSAARNFSVKLRKSVDEIRRFPYSGATVENLSIDGMAVRRKIIQNYILIYYPNPDKKLVTVLRIFHGSRNAEDVLQNLSS